MRSSTRTTWRADDPDISVAYAEALTLASEIASVSTAQPRTLIEQALKVDPQNQRGLWLLGIADYQDGNYDAAIANWNRLLAALPKDSTSRNRSEARSRAPKPQRDGKPLPAER